MRSPFVNAPMSAFDIPGLLNPSLTRTLDTHFHLHHHIDISTDLRHLHDVVSQIHTMGADIILL
jgi:hypothetical protein